MDSTKFEHFVTNLIWCFFAGLLTISQVNASALTIVNQGEPLQIYSSSLALIVGQAEYTGAEWPRLASIGNEVKTVRTVLENQGFDVSVRLNLKSDDLKQAVQGFLQARHEKSARLVVFIAGHGWTDQMALTGHIVPVDAPATSNPRFRPSLLDMEVIKSWSRASDAQQILFLFDSCFSGAVFMHRSGYTPPAKLFLNDALRRTRQFITAGDERQAVPAVSQFVPALSHALSDGLADYNRDGLITANELGMWVKQQVINSGTTTPQYGELPEPRSIPGSMIFVAGGVKTVNRKTEVASAAPNDTPSSIRRAAAIGETAVGMEVFRGLDILYYRKAIDGRAVIDVLEAAKVPFIETRALLPDRFPINAIACGPDTPVGALKSLARTLLQGGVPVRVILQYGDPSRLKGDLEIISLTKSGAGRVTLDSPALTEADILNLNSCPKWLQKPGVE